MSVKSHNNSKVDYTNNDTSGDNVQVIEQALKDLLDKILTYFEKFIRSKEDLKNLESKLNDYENVLSLIDVIKDVFGELTEKIDKKIPIGEDGGYEQLEKTMQKYEGEIRTHIRIEQQLKLYAESLQTKYDDSEKSRTELLESTKLMINTVKRDNQKLAESLRQAKDDNEKLLAKINSLQDITNQYEEKLSLYPSLQERVRTLERMLTDTKSGSNKLIMQSLAVNPNSNSKELHSINNMKKLNLEVDYNKSHLKTEGSNTSAVYYKSSPMKIQPRSNSGSRPSSAVKAASNSSNNSNNEYLKVKIEITNDKNKGDDNRYNFSSKNPREHRHTNVATKTRDVRTIYNAPSGHNSSNNSIIYSGNTSTQVSSSGLHKRSRSTCPEQKSRGSISKGKFDLSTIYAAAQQENWPIANMGNPAERKSRYL